MSSYKALLYLALFPIVFVVWWCFMCYLLSFLSGWHRLTARFRSDSPFEGFLKRYASARMRWVNINGALNVGSNSEGLHLSIMIIFRVGMPQLVWTGVPRHQGSHQVPLLGLMGWQQAPVLRLLGRYSLA